jgi:hypothetical protein
MSPLKFRRLLRFEFPDVHVELTRGSHFKIFRPDRGRFVIASGTPSDRFAIKKIRRDVERMMRVS